MNLRNSWVALPLLAAATLVHAEPFTYVVTGTSVTDLGTLGGNNSSAQDINDRGDIVGYAAVASGKSHAFIYVDGVMSSLHGPAPAFESAIAYAINNQRLVVGQYSVDAFPYPEDARPFYYYPGIWLTSMSANASPGLGYEWSATAFGVNEAGISVGRAVNTDDFPPPGMCHQSVAVGWNNTISNPLRLFCIPDPDGDGTWVGQGLMPAAYDINKSKNIVGTDGGTTEFSMFLRKDGVVTAVPAPAGAPLFAGATKLFGVARGLNDKNWVAGTFGHDHEGAFTFYVHAFVWDGTSASSQDLGLLPGGTKSFANEINEQYMVSGYGDRKWLVGGVNYRRYQAYIWHSDFGMVALPSLASTLALAPPVAVLIPKDCWAYSLNDRKSSGLVQVVGACTTASGNLHAVRWDINVMRIAPLVPSL